MCVTVSREKRFRSSSPRTMETDFLKYFYITVHYVPRNDFKAEKHDFCLCPSAVRLRRTRTPCSSFCSSWDSSPWAPTGFWTWPPRSSTSPSLSSSAQFSSVSHTKSCANVPFSKSNLSIFNSFCSWSRLQASCRTTSSASKRESCSPRCRRWMTCSPGSGCCSC